MRTTPSRLLMVALASWFALGVLGASSASAAVNCADLRTQRAAQSYFEGPSAGVARLDSDGDGRACETNTPISDGKWTLLGLGVLIAVVFAGHRVSEKRRLEALAAGVRRWASVGSIDTLVGSLRRVSSDQRMQLLEEFAHSHGAPPQDVLDALAVQDHDLALQRWALVGYGPPAHVRVMSCSCVGAARNFRLSVEDEVRSWTCASCGSPHTVGVDTPLGRSLPR